MPTLILRILLFTAVIFATVETATAQSTRGRTAPTGAARGGSPYAQEIDRRVDSLFARLAENEPIEALRDEAQALFLETIAWLPDEQADGLMHAALVARLFTQLADVPADVRGRLAPFLATHRRTAAAVAFAVDPTVQPAAGVYALLDRLRDRFGDALETFPYLTAAICVVHDRPFARGINENRPSAPDPLAIFDFFVRTERNMLLGIRDMPTELLLYVVDVTGTIDELDWMQRRHRGDQAVGRLYFDIRYDHDHARRGTPKRSTAAGWNLPSIAQHGGVCADQAYYAMMAGKSIGVPTVYVSGRGHDTGHAWVGFMQAARNVVSFNFDFGRYEHYQGIKGDVMDPQRRRTIPDSFAGILAEMSAAPAIDRYRSKAFVDAASVLRGSGRERTVPALPPAPADIAESHRRAASRTPSTADRLALTALALRQCPGNADGWRMLGSIAEDGGLDTAAKRRWAETLDRLCGTRYPEFSLAVLKPMIASVPDVTEQNTMWNALFANFSARRDLAAEIRIEQGKMWEAASNPDNAWRCYEDVILRYVNAGPFVLEALSAADRLIRQHGSGEQLLELYRRVWSEITPPERFAPQFIRGSTYYRVGDRYARTLDQAGLGQQAAAVRSTLSTLGQGSGGGGGGNRGRGR